MDYNKELDLLREKNKKLHLENNRLARENKYLRERGKEMSRHHMSRMTEWSKLAERWIPPVVLYRFTWLRWPQVLLLQQEWEKKYNN